MLHFDDIVFGPIKSRRLGNSLGMNILPSKGKTCNFDCVYCECGWNKDGAVSGRRFPTGKEVEEALESYFSRLCAEGTPVDSITMSGNGEPTLNPDCPYIVDATIRLRGKYFPDAKVSVLSNATTLSRPGVFEALQKVDNPILKIDAASDGLIGRINQPCGKYSLSQVVENLKRFDGNFILQTMFLRSPDFDTTAQENIDSWIDIVLQLRPREVMVYTIDRETPDSRLGKCTVEQMKMLTKPLADAGIPIQIRG